MLKQIRKNWLSMLIKKKILLFCGAVLVACILSVVFNIWVVKFSLVDFSNILEDNSKSVRLVQMMEQEKEAFQAYVQRKEISLEELNEIMECTRVAVYELPFEYGEIGAERYAQTWSIRSSYEVYVERREDFLHGRSKNAAYISKLYELYEMQDYIILYAKNLMTDTLEMGSAEYQKKAIDLVKVPWLVIGAGVVLILIIVNLAQMMNQSIIVPIMKLVNASKRMASNEYTVEDVEVENKDELGELVQTFNEMQYATRDYINALEEKRETLDLLHKEELEKLAVEKQLESIKLDLLKSQVNPHFLFNTLNVISGMANLEDAPTTEKMIKALSSLFRYNLKTHDMEVPLSRELKVAEDYLYLQQMRFGNRITYEMECEVDKERALVPAFTFQPLIENAIIHGLSRKEEGGSIKIRVRMRRKKLYIFIGDTGKGLKAEELSKLKENLKKQKEQEGHGGIGLGNIYRRVNAMYSEGKVEIYSKENVGTVIIVVVPQRNEEAYVSSDSSR